MALRFDYVTIFGKAFNIKCQFQKYELIILSKTGKYVSNVRAMYGTQNTGIGGLSHIFQICLFSYLQSRMGI